MLFKNWTWTILGALALFVRWLASSFPEKTEAIYSRTVFPEIRYVIDVSISSLPFPSFYFFVVLLLLVLGIFIFHVKKKEGWKTRAGYSIRFFSNLSGMVVFFFLVLWGYNYQRVPVVQQLSL